MTMHRFAQAFLLVLFFSHQECFAERPEEEDLAPSLKTGGQAGPTAASDSSSATEDSSAGASSASEDSANGSETEDASLTAPFAEPAAPSGAPVLAQSAIAADAAATAQGQTPVGATGKTDGDLPAATAGANTNGNPAAATTGATGNADGDPQRKPGVLRGLLKAAGKMIARLARLRSSKQKEKAPVPEPVVEKSLKEEAAAPKELSKEEEKAITGLENLKLESYTDATIPTEADHKTYVEAWDKARQKDEKKAGEMIDDFYTKNIKRHYPDLVPKDGEHTTLYNTVAEKVMAMNTGLLTRTEKAAENVLNANERAQGSLDKYTSDLKDLSKITSQTYGNAEKEHTDVVGEIQAVIREAEHAAKENSSPSHHFKPPASQTTAHDTESAWIPPFADESKVESASPSTKADDFNSLDNLFKGNLHPQQ